MKKIIKSKKILIALVAVLCLGALGVVGKTYSYFTAQTSTVRNTFTVGNVTTVIKEDFTIEDNKTFKKNPTVMNTGKNACYIRMRVTISPQGGVAFKDLDTTNWVYNENDDFYYYQLAVEPNNSTTPIFTGGTIDGTIQGDFEITCYQEAVQAIAVIEGTETEDMMTIWKAYDSGKGITAAD